MNAQDGTSLFMELPTEIIIEILAHLDVKDILACSEVCRRLMNIVDKSEQLQDKIELEFQEVLRLQAMRDMLPPELQDDDDATLLLNAVIYMERLQTINEQLEARLDAIQNEQQALVQSMGLQKDMSELGIVGNGASIDD